MFFIKKERTDYEEYKYQVQNTNLDSRLNMSFDETNYNCDNERFPNAQQIPSSIEREMLTDMEESTLKIDSQINEAIKKMSILIAKL